jgi:hypothetical protein
VARVLSTAVVLALLAATAAAFVVTEGAKLEKSPIFGTRVDPVFSPAGVVSAKKDAHIRFRLRTRERLAVWIQDSEGHRVASLLSNRNAPRGSRFDLVWDGFSPSGVIFPDGVYKPVVKLERSHRTLVLPNPITLDTKAPVITVKHPQYPLLSPDGDGHGDTFKFHYQVSEPAHAILAVRGRRVLFTLGQKLTGELVWDGKVRNSQKQLVRARPGRYLLTVSAQDRAGNVSKGVPFAIAQVRYVVLARKRVVVVPNHRFFLRVSTDAPTVHWRLHGRSGILPSGTLRLRAPKRAGVYHLYVNVGTHSATSTIVVA